MTTKRPHERRIVVVASGEGAEKTLGEIDELIRWMVEERCRDDPSKTTIDAIDVFFLFENAARTHLLEDTKQRLMTRYGFGSTGEGGVDASFHLLSYNRDKVVARHDYNPATGGPIRVSEAAVEIGLGEEGTLALVLYSRCPARFLFLKRIVAEEVSRSSRAYIRRSVLQSLPPVICFRQTDKLRELLDLRTGRVRLESHAPKDMLVIY